MPKHYDKLDLIDLDDWPDLVNAIKCRDLRGIHHILEETDHRDMNKKDDYIEKCLEDEDDESDFYKELLVDAVKTCQLNLFNWINQNFDSYSKKNITEYLLDLYIEASYIDYEDEFIQVLTPEQIPYLLESARDKQELSIIPKILIECADDYDEWEVFFNEMEPSHQEEMIQSAKAKKLWEGFAERLSGLKIELVGGSKLYWAVKQEEKANWSDDDDKDELDCNTIKIDQVVRKSLFITHIIMKKDGKMALHIAPSKARLKNNLKNQEGDHVIAYVLLSRIMGCCQGTPIDKLPVKLYSLYVNLFPNESESAGRKKKEILNELQEMKTKRKELLAQLRKIYHNPKNSQINNQIKKSLQKLEANELARYIQTFGDEIVQKLNQAENACMMQSRKKENKFSETISSNSALKSGGKSEGWAIKALENQETWKNSQITAKNLEKLFDYPYTSNKKNDNYYLLCESIAKFIIISFTSFEAQMEGLKADDKINIYEEFIKLILENQLWKYYKRGDSDLTLTCDELKTDIEKFALLDFELNRLKLRSHPETPESYILPLIDPLIY